jgi:hypothetical protein
MLLTSWLISNPSAHLVILSGNVTQDSMHPRDNHGSAGIQNFYFNDIRNTQKQLGVDLRSRVLVCNYNVPGTNPKSKSSLNKSHEVMFKKTNQFLQQAPLTSCPTVHGLDQGASWKP